MANSPDNRTESGSNVIPSRLTVKTQETAKDLDIIDQISRWMRDDGKEVTWGRLDGLWNAITHDIGSPTSGVVGWVPSRAKSEEAACFDLHWQIAIILDQSVRAARGSTG